MYEANQLQWSTNIAAPQIFFFNARPILPMQHLGMSFNYSFSQISDYADSAHAYGSFEDFMLRPEFIMAKPDVKMGMVDVTQYNMSCTFMAIFPAADGSKTIAMGVCEYANEPASINYINPDCTIECTKVIRVDSYGIYSLDVLRPNNQYIMPLNGFNNIPDPNKIFTYSCSNMEDYLMNHDELCTPMEIETETHIPSGIATPAGFTQRSLDIVNKIASDFEINSSVDKLVGYVSTGIEGLPACMEHKCTMRDVLAAAPNLTHTVVRNQTEWAVKPSQSDEEAVAETMLSTSLPMLLVNCGLIDISFRYSSYLATNPDPYETGYRISHASTADIAHVADAAFAKSAVKMLTDNLERTVMPLIYDIGGHFDVTVVSGTGMLTLVSLKYADRYNSKEEAFVEYDNRALSSHSPLLADTETISKNMFRMGEIVEMRDPNL
jgi:hypothetical protein